MSKIIPLTWDMKMLIKLKEMEGRIVSAGAWRRSRYLVSLSSRNLLDSTVFVANNTVLFSNILFLMLNVFERFGKKCVL